METRTRIHYKEKYIRARATALFFCAAFVVAMLMLLGLLKRDLDRQAKFISPNGVAAEITEGK